MSIPSKYQPRLLDKMAKEGYLNWSLDFFTDPQAISVPYVDITIQLDVTKAYQLYQDNFIEGATFFGFLTWHLLQTLKSHFCFNLRRIENQWFILDNPPVVVPVAVGGQERFREMYLENVNQISYPEFIVQYRQKLDHIRSDRGANTPAELFLLSCFLGNLPNLQFTGLTLHSQQNAITGQPYFYFGKRYWQNDRLLIPFAAKLHHACQDPLVLDLLIQDLHQRFVDDSRT